MIGIICSGVRRTASVLASATQAAVRQQSVQKAKVVSGSANYTHRSICGTIAPRRVPITPGPGILLMGSTGSVTSKRGTASGKRRNRRIMRYCLAGHCLCSLTVIQSRSNLLSLLSLRHQRCQQQQVSGQRCSAKGAPQMTIESFGQSSATIATDRQRVRALSSRLRGAQPQYYSCARNHRSDTSGQSNIAFSIGLAFRPAHTLVPFQSITSKVHLHIKC
ncbi:hypothetical protein AND_004565 [Anopheles darlingi]|uniref:Uncharacterized protein n=1 Tax=Anopheles darlingi TaxID=43151 RepID=W5JH79_ANODA|nr:hypothetical protein AND_004565 [Anopheles darlingi]